MQRGAALCLRLWLCLGLLDSERGEPSACPSVQLATRGDIFPGQMVGPHRWETGGGQGPRDPPARDRVGSQGFRHRKEHGESGRACRDEERAGTGRGAAPQLRGGAQSPTALHSLWLSSLGPGPLRAAPSAWILRLLTRFPAKSRHRTVLSSNPRALGIVPPRRGCNPRRVVDLGAHFPTPLVCARDWSSRGNSGWCLPSPGQGLRGQGLGIVGDRRCVADWAQVPVGT